MYQYYYDELYNSHGGGPVYYVVELYKHTRLVRSWSYDSLFFGKRKAKNKIRELKEIYGATAR